MRSTIAETGIGGEQGGRVVGTLAVVSESERKQRRGATVVLGAGMLDRQAMRRAVVLKEILSAPVGLRDPLQQF